MLYILGQRDIRELQVRCDNVQRGCNTVVTIGTLDNHVNKCEYCLVPCPNGCKAWREDLQLMRKELDNHLKTECLGRDYVCKHCGEKGTYANITEEHYQKCEKVIVPCPNPCCPLVGEHGQILEHIRTVCQYTVVTCQYANIGCGVKMIRKDIKKHEKSTAHFQLALDKITELNVLGSFPSLENVVCSHDEQLKALKGQSMTFKLSGYGKMKERNEVFFSEPFYTNIGGYKMRIKVDPNGGNVCSDSAVLSLYFVMLKGVHDNQLQWPFMGRVKFELLNQLTDENHHNFEMQLDSTHNILVDDFWGYPEFITNSELDLNSPKSTQYLMEDTLYFRVSMEVKDCKSWLYCTH